MMILFGMMFVARRRLCEAPIAGVDRSAFNVEAIVCHRVLCTANVQIASIYTIINFTRLSVVSVTVAAALAGWPMGVVDTRLTAATLSGRGARVYTCTCVHDNIPCRRLPK